jgi:hypothetical protein
MFDKKRGQISTEYLIVIGFLTFFIIVSMGVAFYYVGGISDSIKENQIAGFGQKVVSSAENVYYAGAPSKLTIQVYLPPGVTDISVVPNNFFANYYGLQITYSSNSGTNTRTFQSGVPLSGSISSTQEGVQTVVLTVDDLSTPQTAKICSGSSC